MNGEAVIDRPRVGIVISTTREGRFGDVPAEWFYEVAARRGDMEFEVLDLRDFPLPLFGEDSSGDAASRWSEKMESLDGYVFITAEYNHSITGVLKNALDYLGSEVRRKPAAFVGYGGVGGARAVQQLRLIVLELQMASVRNAVHIGMEPILGVRKEGRDFSDYEFLVESANATLDDLSWWTHALKAGREASLEAVR